MPEGLSEYKVHCLHCKGDESAETDVQNDAYNAENAENEVQSSGEDSENKEAKGAAVDSDVSIGDGADKENTEAENAGINKQDGTESKQEAQSGDLKKRKKEAMATNSCRGYVEGDKNSICRRYIRCSDCWADFK